VSRGSFPGLGFDPTPGELTSVAAVLDSLQNACQLIEEAMPRLFDAATITDDAEWGGSAAEEFSDHGDDLPQGLNTGAVAMSAVGETLAEWFGQMKANQDHAEELETRAKQLQKDLEAADAAMRDAGDAVPMSDHPRYPELHQAWQDASTKRDGIAADLDALIARAHRLEATHERNANTAAEAIRGAQDDSPFKPAEDGFGVQVLDGISAVSGEVAKWSATAATVAAFVPGGQGVAAGLTAVSGAATVVNVASSLGQKAVGSANAPSWGQIALAAVPAKTASSAIKGARGGFTAAQSKGTQEALASAGRRGLDGARKGFARNNAYAQARKGVEDVKRAREGLNPKHTHRSSGKDVAGGLAKAPFDAVDSANNLVDEDRKQESTPLRVGGHLAGIPADPIGGLVDAAKSEGGKLLPNPDKDLSTKQSETDDDWHRRP
jgi:hypothetical protein